MVGTRQGGPGGLQGGGWRARLGLLPLTLLLCRGGNLTLLHFLLGLRTAPDDELVAELVVSILRVCPDLLHKYFKEVTFSFLPRAKATWANNVRLLHKVRRQSWASAAGAAADRAAGEGDGDPPSVGCCRSRGCGPSPPAPVRRAQPWLSLESVEPVLSSSPRFSGSESF